VLLGALAATVPGTLNAQSTTQGAILGTVMDSSGAVVPSAAVTIRNSATGFTVKLTSDAGGFFKAPLLEPGSYTVTITSTSFANYTANSVLVVVGQVTSLEPRLAIASSSAEVVVSEQTPVMNSESPDFTATLNQKALQNIPINNRKWSALAMTTPGVVSDINGAGLVSVRGISANGNNVEIDGADDNEAFYAVERGYTVDAYSTAGSAVREFAVNTGVYSAEYGRAAGGVVLSVTQSGTNQIHGQAYFYDRESNWNAYNDHTFLSVLNPTTNAYVSDHLKPEDLRKIYGFTVGGAVIKDKLFWIDTYDQQTHVFPGTAIPANPASFFSLPAATTTGTCNLSTGYLSGDTNPLDADACTLAARQNMTSYAAGAAAYDTWISNLNTELGFVHRVGYQEINTPKIDWQITPTERWSALYHRMRWDSPGALTTTTANYATDSWGNSFVKLDYGITKLTSLITNNISNEVLYQFSRELIDDSALPLSAYTQANLVGNGISVNGTRAPSVALDTAEGFNLGISYFTYRRALPLEYKWQIGDIAYWNRGKHSVRLGIDMVHNYDDVNANGTSGNGAYVYSYVGNYINDQMNFLEGRGGSCNSSAARNGSASSSAVGSDACYSSFSQTFGPNSYSISTLDSGAFIQDNWKFSPRLTLELGLRWDAENLPPPNATFTAATGSFTPYPQLLNSPSDKLNFGPRVGFAYDLFGKGSTVLRGGYGLYYGRINNGQLLYFRFSTGSPAGQYATTWHNTTTGAPNLPNIVPSGSASVTPTSNFLASNLRSPEVQEFDLQLQQAVGRGTVFSLSYLGALGRKLPNFLDLNLNPVQTPLTVTISDPSGLGPLTNGATYVVPQYTGYGNTNLFGSAAANFQSITEMISNINSSYNAVVAEVQNRSLKSVQFDANYTWSHALDFGQTNVYTNTGTSNWFDPYNNPRANYGDSPSNEPNRLVAYALYSLPNIARVNPLHWVINDWSVDDSFQMMNGLPYTVGVSGFFSQGSVSGILSGWNGAAGEAYGTEITPIIGVNTKRYPRHIVDDARVEKAIDFAEGRSLHLMCNIFNLANHQNIDGLGTTAYKLSGTTATYQPSTFGIPTSSNNSGFLFTPREVEIAAKFVF
jgi:hypothetical protein